MTMINRSQPDADPGIALTQLEMEVLDQLIKKPLNAPASANTLSHYITKIAKLGGYLDRSNDPALGNIVMWRGLASLTPTLFSVPH